MITLKEQEIQFGLSAVTEAEVLRGDKKRLEDKVQCLMEEVVICPCADCSRQAVDGRTDWLVVGRWSDQSRRTNMRNCRSSIRA